MNRLSKLSTICKYVERVTFAGLMVSGLNLVVAIFVARNVPDHRAVTAQALIWPLVWTAAGFAWTGFVAAVLPDQVWRISRRRSRVYQGKQS